MRDGFRGGGAGMGESQAENRWGEFLPDDIVGDGLALDGDRGEFHKTLDTKGGLLRHLGQ